MKIRAKFSGLSSPPACGLVTGCFINHIKEKLPCLMTDCNDCVTGLLNGHLTVWVTGRT